MRGRFGLAAPLAFPGTDGAPVSATLTVNGVQRRHVPDSWFQQLGQAAMSQAGQPRIGATDGAPS
jgi:hypothetical protein